MSSPVYDPKNREGHLMYAPKSVRDSNFQSSPGIAEGEFPQDREPSNPIEGLTADQGDSPHSLEFCQRRRCEAALVDLPAAC